MFATVSVTDYDSRDVTVDRTERYIPKQDAQRLFAEETQAARDAKSVDSETNYSMGNEYTKRTFVYSDMSSCTVEMWS